jgi:arsenite transporter
MVLGTALLPATMLPVLMVAPALGSFWDVLAAAARLALVITGCSGTAFALRHWMREPGPAFFVRTDGAVAIVMAVLVIALMSAVAPALRTEPGTVALYCAVAFAASFGLQVAATLALRAVGRGSEAGAYGICAGNRNIGLFLTALPPATTDPLLLFIGCYQIPMYLTPLMLRRFYEAAVPEPHR